MRPRSIKAKLAVIVAFVATMLGGAFFSYHSAGVHSRDRAASSDDALFDDSRASQNASTTMQPLGSKASNRTSPDHSKDDDELLAEVLRRGDKAELDRFMPHGIRQIDGMGGKGLNRQVKSHGLWFPVFDLSPSISTGGSADKPDPDKVKVNKVPLSIVSPPPSSGIVGQAFSYAFAAVGGEPPYQWTMQGGDGHFALNPVTGVLTGTTSEPVNAVFTITVMDTANATSSVAAALAIKPLQSLQITTADLSTAVVGDSYSFTLNASGGQPPYTWSIANAPAGWACDSSGVITAMPQEPADVDLDITVIDSQQSTDTRLLHVHVTEGLAITTESPLMPAAPGESYQLTFEASGGVTPYHWSVASGSLPSGWRLGEDGVLRGIAGSQEQMHRFTVEVRDSMNKRQRHEFDLALRHLLIAVPSREHVGLAWQPAEVQRAMNAPVIGVTVERNGIEIYRGTGFNVVDHGLATGGTYRYTLTAHGADGSTQTVSSTLVRVLPFSLARATPGKKADPYADRVFAFQPLAPGAYGSNALPLNVTGPPDGKDTFTPAYRSTEVASLTASAQGGGSITLEFTDNIIENGPGDDFTVFENVLFVGGDPNNRYVEPATIEVALFENQWFRFPARINPPASGQPNFRQPGYYAQGFAGMNATTGDDPTDPTRSGGDSFDLGALGVPDLQWIRFVRIRSTGDNSTPDASGVLIRHTSENNALSGTGASGFDLDAVSATHF